MELGNSTGMAKVAENLRAVAAPIFAATLVNGSKGGVVTVHVSSVAKRKSVESSIRAAVETPVRIRFHSAASLTAPRSLEKLVRRFKCDEIIYDPTEAMTRAKALVDGAASVRASLGSKLSGVFYAPRLRTLFFALSSKAMTVGDKVKIAELADVERNILSALRAAFAGKDTECPAVRVGFGVPRAELVPVDQMSVASFGHRVAQAVRRYWKPAAIAAMLGFGSATAAAAREPAVSTPNLKVIATAGETNSESTWVVGGGLTLPVGNEWGLQIGAGAAGIGDSNIYGTSGQLFWRDPDKYLLGLFAAYAAEDQYDLEDLRFGAEAEIYLDQISIIANAGYQFSDNFGDDGFVGGIELKWYLNDNLALSGGTDVSEFSTRATGSIEWMPGFDALPGLAFRVDGVVGDDDYRSIMGGLTFYFGADASLKDRHRKQDPMLGWYKSMEELRAYRHYCDRVRERGNLYGCYVND